MTTNKNPNRETWLNELAALMAPRFAELGFPLPAFRVAVGFPSCGKDGRAAAECWNAKCSADGKFEILIRPDEGDSMMIAGHLAHELTHAAVGFDQGHKGNFAKVVLALGLLRPLTATVPGESFKTWARPFLDQLGAIPHAPLRWGAALAMAPREGGADGEAADDDAAPLVGGGSSNARKKQSTRLVKCVCGECGYTVRTTRKWLEVGPPHCPAHGAMDADVDAFADPDAE